MLVPTAEGFYDYEKKQYIYNYKDHLGNIRVSYAKNSEGVLTILDHNDYYPFGMNFVVSQKPLFSPKSGWENYKYNGKELQETGMYDYGARMYTVSRRVKRDEMPDIGRWGVVDPLAEKAPGWTPYRYGYNNPISFTDPTGMSEDWYETEGGDMVFDDNVKSQKDLTDRGIQGTYKYESGQEGNLTYAADGYVYDDSTAGGGQPIENGRLNNIEEVTITKTSPIKSVLNSDAWNSAIARMIVPDVINLNFTNNIVVFGGVNFSLANVTILTRGNAGVYTTPSIGLSIANGGNGNLEASLSTGTFTGNPRKLNASNLSGFSGGMSAGIGLGPTVSAGVSYAPSDYRSPQNGGIIYTTVSGGVGARIGATVATVQGNLNYTPESGVQQIIKFR